MPTVCLIQAVFSSLIKFELAVKVMLKFVLICYNM